MILGHGTLYELFVGPVADYEFFAKAMFTAVVVGTSTALVSCLMVVRRSVMFGDALAHAVLLGVVIGWLLAGDLGVMPGALIVAVLMATAIVFLQRTGVLGFETGLGVLFTACFAGALAIMSWREPRGFSLDALLLGNVLAISDADIWMSVLGALMLVVTIVLSLRAVRCWTFHPEVAQVLGVRVKGLEYLMAILMGVTVVIALKTVGIVLVIALISCPGAAARLLTDRLGPMLVWAAGIGAAGTCLGLYASYHLDIAAGPSVALVLTAMFILVLLIAPSSGVVAQRLNRYRALHSDDAEQVLIGLWSLGGPERVEVSLGLLGDEGALNDHRFAQATSRLRRSGAIGLDDDAAWLTEKGAHLAQACVRRSLGHQHTRVARVEAP
jgi:ABC-type Mn2+/Zn2+ transport system permease subunit